MARIRTWFSLALARFTYMLAESYRHFGNKYHLESEYRRAIEAFTRAIAYRPDFAQAYLARGILYWREMDQPQLAIDDLTTAYELDATLIEARFNRGIAYQQLRAYGDAIADFRAYLVEGNHPHWRDYAERMLSELAEWISDAGDRPASAGNE
jgi:tetratricopeptide (TPR) repeat protein